MKTSPERKTRSAKASSAGRGAVTVPFDSGVNFSVVALGASAGGLEACKRLVSALPPDNGMAFILIQHLDPTHESMMVDLLAGHTTMKVQQARDGMRVERDHLYVIPPGAYLSVAQGALQISQPQVRHGARLPFDFLLHSLAIDFGERAICVILSGTGSDGSAGLKSVKENGGLIVAQDPDDATYDGMPRSAIMTGAVDLVLPVKTIAAALIKYDRRMRLVREANGGQHDAARDWLPEIVDLLRTKTTHDFALYKQGTLRRRIERRMAMAAIDSEDMASYLDLLHRDTAELDLLAKDLLINVTSFFRDPKVFEVLAEKVIQNLARGHTSDRALRVWIAACSTGEEAYSLAILFREEMTKAKRNLKLQIFASDVDPNAIAIAREGLYPMTIEADVSPERLARFFIKEDHGYRILPELRALVVFTVQDVLADPPFARLDLVSCRNFLIYLLPEAQAKVISLFQFALRESGILLLGTSETAGDIEGRFEVISKSERLYRHLGRTRSREIGFALSFDGMQGADGSRGLSQKDAEPVSPRPTALADLCRRIVMENYAPAALLINGRYECVYSLGPTDRYLHVALGHASHDVISMTPPRLHARLRSAIQRAVREKAAIFINGGRINRNNAALSVRIAVQPVPSTGDDFLLICFIDEPKPPPKETRPPAAERDLPRVAELERELQQTRTDLQDAIRELESAAEEQKTINEEASSVNEEFQATNEELLASKEELQSLNEELTALNSQLQETLERQRTTANDLQNVLNSTDVATLFLDPQLNIRLFTPATRLLFNIIPGDIGRPLADLSALAVDINLAGDAQRVLETLAPVEREIEARSGAWYNRRILPYRTNQDGVGGVVITFTDITERRHSADRLEEAKQQAQLANAAKSKFLAAASHDLRQPLQTLSLLQGLLSRAVEGARERKLVSRIDDTLFAMSGMLNALLDINQIEAGTVRPEVIVFPVNDIIRRVKNEFDYHARAKGLSLHFVPCSLWVQSDPRLLEQIIRNILSNAIKYTQRGKVLIGCRRHAEIISIEIRDTGIGIPSEELEAIFDEYHQIGNQARERSRGLGLGLSIVQRLAVLLGHKIRVHSNVGQGSVFRIEVLRLAAAAAAPTELEQLGVDRGAADDPHRAGVVLIVEDDPDILDTLALLLRAEGHTIVSAVDGVSALELVTRDVIRPDVVLADYNLPNDLSGLQLAAILRERLHRQVPVIILTGDISTNTLSAIARQRCVQLNKPVKADELTLAIRKLLPASPPNAVDLKPLETDRDRAPPVIFVVDDDRNVREALRSVLEDEGRVVEDYETCEAFLGAYRPGQVACLLIDAYLPGMSGMELLRTLNKRGHQLPAIMITGNSDVAMAVLAMKAGALDFIEKPVSRGDLMSSVERALEQSLDSSKLVAWRENSTKSLASLTVRQRQIMEMILAGHPSKNIAADLGISQRTVENHRASIMRKTGSKSLPALARLALTADPKP
jgi:two-component system, chemotaxis family, CheB/CheR fusion protein